MTFIHPATTRRYPSFRTDSYTTLLDATAREDISHQVDLIAEWMRISRQAAKVYVTEEYISGFADHIAAVIDRHNQAVRIGEVSDLSAKRRQRFPRPHTAD